MSKMVFTTAGTEKCCKSALLFQIIDAVTMSDFAEVWKTFRLKKILSFIFSVTEFIPAVVASISIYHGISACVRSML